MGGLSKTGTGEPSSELGLGFDNRAFLELLEVFMINENELAEKLITNNQEWGNEKQRESMNRINLGTPFIGVMDMKTNIRRTITRIRQRDEPFYHIKCSIKDEKIIIALPCIL